MTRSHADDAAPQRTRADEPAGPVAVDRLLMSYLTLIGVLFVLVGGLRGLPFAGVHAAAVLAIHHGARRWRSTSGIGRFLRGSYPVLLTPLLYAELGILDRALRRNLFDVTIQSWERALFGGQPSLWLSDALPWLPLSEALHLGYVSYYAIVPVALIGVYSTRGPAALDRTAFAVALAFFLSYVIFVLLPVAGPRYEFAPIGGDLSRGTLYQLVHAILESASSRGTAFPSSHVAASLAAVLGAGREDRRWLWLLIVPEAALAVGTVYGRFHYAVDALAGVALGLAAWWAAPRLMRALGERTR